jgi:hypothetical protein
VGSWTFGFHVQRVIRRVRRVGTTVWLSGDAERAHELDPLAFELVHRPLEVTESPAVGVCEPAGRFSEFEAVFIATESPAKGGHEVWSRRHALVVTESPAVGVCEPAGRFSEFEAVFAATESPSKGGHELWSQRHVLVDAGLSTAGRSQEVVDAAASVVRAQFADAAVGSSFPDPQIPTLATPAFRRR